MKDFLLELLRLVRPYRMRLVLGILCGVLAGLSAGLLTLAVQLAFNLLFPGTGGTTIDAHLARLPTWLAPFAQRLMAAIPEGVQDHRSTFTVLAIAAIPAIMFVRGLGTYLNLYLLNWVSLRGVNDLRRRLFAHLQNLSVDFFSQSRTGDLISRIYNDTFQMQGALCSWLGTIIAAPMTILFLIVLLFSKEPRLTLVALTVLPICIVPIAIYSRKVRKSVEGIHAEAAQISSVMHEAFTASRLVKAYNLESVVQNQFSESLKRYVNHWMRAVRAMELPGPMIEFCGSVGISFIFVYLAGRKESPMLAGDFLSFVAQLFFLYQPIKQLSRLQGELQRARGASRQIFEMLRMQPTVVDPVDPIPAVVHGGRIEFDHVNFSYGEKRALDDFNLTIEPGQMVALVGLSGSGKTTVTSLLLRFYDPSSGTVRIGGIDIRKFALADLRRNIAFVSQDVLLFNETIGRNIAFGKPGATEQETRLAAEQAQASEFILGRPEGFDYQVGERGVNLSGGQRQRIAIARAILRDAPILILDEATSALDNESERAVQAAFDQLMKGRTTLVIAHRLSTIQHADVIVVLEQGRIIETGRHAELLARNGVYRRLHDLSFQAPGGN